MWNRRIIAAVMMAGSLCGMGAAYAADAERDALIQQTIKLSGLKAQIDQFPAVMHAQLAARQRDVPPEVYEKMSPVFAEASRTDLALQSVTKSFEAQYDHDKLVQIVQRLKSPLFMKMTALETVSADATQEHVQAFIAEVQQTPPPEARLAIMRRLSQATDTAAMLERISLALTKGLAKGMASAMDVVPPAPGEVEAAIHQQAVANAEMIESGALLRNLYTYRTATDPELEEYVSFLETELGRWLTATGANALIQAYVDMTERMGGQLADIAKSMPRKPKPWQRCKHSTKS